MAYTKLHSSILDSSIWFEKPTTRCVWITFLAACNAEGIVSGSMRGLAKKCNVTMEEFEESILVLTSPDSDSRTKDLEGRRIEDLGEGNWRIINYQKHRDMCQAKPKTDAERMRAYRSKKKENSHERH